MSTLRAEAEGVSEIEDPESFRQRARAFIRANLRQVTVGELRSERSNGDEEAELASLRCV